MLSGLAFPPRWCTVLGMSYFNLAAETGRLAPTHQWSQRLILPCERDGQGMT